MNLKKVKRLTLLVFFFVLFLPFGASAKVIAGEAALVSELSKEGVGGDESLEMIKASQNQVKKDYKKTDNAQITWGDVVGYNKTGDGFIVLSFNASIFSTSTKPAVFSLLFQKQAPGKLEYASSFLAWIDQRDIKAYTGISQKALCSLFQNQTGFSICQVAGKGSNGIEEPDFETNVKQQLSQAAVKARNADNITEGKLKEPRIDDVICRDSELAAAVSELKVELGKGSTTDAAAQLELTKKIAEIELLKAQIGELEKTVASLATILKGVSREGNNLTFSGMNVYVVSGAGATDATPNGLGNLIVGYNENDNQNKNKTNSGSHNLIVGKNQSYSSYGGFVAGASNKVAAPYATITGGFNNSVGGAYSCVSGGQLNTATGDYATVSGGLTRKAAGNNNWSAGDQSSLK